MAYSEKVMDHFANPRNIGKLEDASGVGEVGNAKCGDIMKMYIRVEDGIITDVKFNTYGCASAIATSSMATEMIKGKPVSEALKLTNKAVIEALEGALLGAGGGGRQGRGRRLLPPAGHRNGNPGLRRTLRRLSSARSLKST